MQRAPIGIYGQHKRHNGDVPTNNATLAGHPTTPRTTFRQDDKAKVEEEENLKFVHGHLPITFTAQTVTRTHDNRTKTQNNEPNNTETLQPSRTDHNHGGPETRLTRDSWDFVTIN